MKYTEFRDVIQNALLEHPEGMTWKEIRDQLFLPYERPCPEWVRRLETEIGLGRTERMGNSLVWRIKQMHSKDLRN